MLQVGSIPVKYVLLAGLSTAEEHPVAHIQLVITILLSEARRVGSCRCGHRQPSIYASWTREYL